MSEGFAPVAERRDRVGGEGVMVEGECSQRTLQLSEVLLLGIESSTSSGFVAEVVESEPIDDINHLLSSILDSILCLFCRRVGADIYT